MNGELIENVNQFSGLKSQPQEIFVNPDIVNQLKSAVRSNERDLIDNTKLKLKLKLPRIIKKQHILKQPIVIFDFDSKCFFVYFLSLSNI